MPANHHHRGNLGGPVVDATGSDEWLHAQVRGYEALRPQYDACAELLRKALLVMCREVAPSAQVQARAKALRSFGQKALLTRSTVKDPLKEFNDLCAARVIVGTREDVQAVKALLQRSFVAVERPTGSSGRAFGQPAFGYRSVHLVFTMPEGVLNGMPVPAEVVGLKAEIQVRTIAEHVWADFAHDRSYKGQVRLPDEWERELNGLAASLEAVDAALLRLDLRMRDFAANYPAYLSTEDATTELAGQRELLSLMPDEGTVARRVAGLAKTLGQWRTIAEALEPFADSDTADLVRDLGVALCKLHHGDWHSEPFQRGRRLLRRATEINPSDADAWASLAGSYKGDDDWESARLYERAYLEAPEDPYPLGNLVESHLRHYGNLDHIRLLRPAFRAALRRCQERAAVGVDLPWSLFDQGRLHLLLQEDEDGLKAYCAGAAAAGADWQLETARRSLDIFQSRHVGASDSARDLLTMVLLTRFGVQADRLPSLDGRVQPGPTVVVVVGGTCPTVRDGLQVVTAALQPGTHQLIIAINQVGTPTTPTNDRDSMPGGALIVASAEIIALLADIVTGPDLEQTAIIAVGPEASSSLGVRAAGVLGLRVGLVDAAPAQTCEMSPDAHKEVWLLKDVDTIRAFLPSTCSGLSQRTNENLARSIHDHDTDRRLQRMAMEPELAGWDVLADVYRDLSRSQAHTIQRVLQAIGRHLLPLPGPAGDVASQLSEGELEQLARAEHGRRCADLLAAGWRWGTQLDASERTSPSLCPWAEMPEDLRELDRDVAREIPAILADAGLAIGSATTHY